MKLKNVTLGILLILPVEIILGFWFSPLAFVPIPSCDDSVFYMVAKDLFQWPPRWAMSVQAPFEYSYAFSNFNTMPLLSLLIGFGRWIGIDSIFAIKFWPLAAWAASVIFLMFRLAKAGLPSLLVALVALGMSLDPAMRWGAMIVRPESLVGLGGVVLVSGLTLGFPAWSAPQRFWDPVAGLLALAAYAHFNAIHLVFAVLVAFARDFRRLVKIGFLCLLYLMPWLLTVLKHWDGFVVQMPLQWHRLAAMPNPWLASAGNALGALYQTFWCPVGWPPFLGWAALGLWILILIALFWGLVIPGLQRFQKNSAEISLAPAATWIAGALWLWHTKPEVWFTYLIHCAVWTFAGILLLRLWNARNLTEQAFSALGFVSVLVLSLVVIFFQANLTQARQLAQEKTWRWATYDRFIDAVDSQLSQHYQDLGNPSVFRVFCPTAPDIIVELSRRHPHWAFTRTNDLRSRDGLAMKHALEAEAVVVTEISFAERHSIVLSAAESPDLMPAVMSWHYWNYLSRLRALPEWKRRQIVCQEGRWLAFLYLS